MSGQEPIGTAEHTPRGDRVPCTFYSRHEPGAPQPPYMAPGDQWQAHDGTYVMRDDGTLHRAAELPWSTYEQIIERVGSDTAFRDGLLAAAAVCRANDQGPVTCPATMAAVYVERLAGGEMP